MALLWLYFWLYLCLHIPRYTVLMPSPVLLSSFVGVPVCRRKEDSGALYQMLLLSSSNQVTKSLHWVCSIASILNGISGRAHRCS